MIFNTSLFQNQTRSFLYPISLTILSLSLPNCTNLIEISWFVIIQFQALYYLDLSEVNMTGNSWVYRKTDVHSEDSSIDWNYSLGPRLILCGIRLTDNDYCLTKSIVDILNKKISTVDIDHSCNCFIYSFDTENRPSCLYNDSLVDELDRRCTNIDLFCEVFSNNATTLPFTDWASLSSLSTTTQITSAHTITTLTSSSNLVSTEQSIITSTHVSSERSNRNQQTKVILAAIILSAIFMTVLYLIGFYLYRRKRSNNLAKDIEICNKTLHITDK